MKWLVAILLLAIGFSSPASHIAGGQITWTFDGVYNFEVTLYHDCAGIPMNSFINLSIDGTYYKCDLKSTEELPLPCQQAVTTCRGGSYTGIEKCIYTTSASLSRGVHTFSWLGCCRNASIIDIYSPDLTDFYIYSTLDNTLKDYDSPTFSGDPFAFVCSGQNICMDIGNYMTSPLKSSTSAVNYVYPYSYAYPVKLTGSLAGNLFCFTPSTLGTGVTAAVVELYDNGRVVASVERDMQITVVDCPCPALPVVISSFEGKPVDAVNYLWWETASEINADYIVIERNWEAIGGMNAAGKPYKYCYIDASPSYATTYRVRMYDMNGKVSYSPYITVVNKNIYTGQWGKPIYNILGQEIPDVR